MHFLVNSPHAAFSLFTLFCSWYATQSETDK
jgi:hypothetical protein